MSLTPDWHKLNISKNLMKAKQYWILNINQLADLLKIHL